MTIFKIKKEQDKKKIKITISPKTKEPISINQIKKYATRLMKRNNIDTENKIYIRGLSNLGFTTIKSLNSDLDNMNNYDDEYFEDNIEDDSQFKQFYEVQYVLFTC
jgi:hypothetical protein